MDGDSSKNPTGKGVVDGNLKAMNVKFDDVKIKVKNDTGVKFTIPFISENQNATGTNYSNWGAGWTRE